jgi:PHD/YefM family antitoxin component YafN of YafNO toxin-antitoxin module
MEVVVANRLSPGALDGVLESIARTGKSLVLVNSTGHRLVVMTEEDYRGWQETHYLLSSAENARVLHEARAEPLENTRSLQDVLDGLDS